MVLDVKEYCNFNLLSIMLNGKPRIFCKSFAYLAQNITETHENNNDVRKQSASIYARGNVIILTY